MKTSLSHYYYQITPDTFVACPSPKSRKQKASLLERALTQLTRRPDADEAEQNRHSKTTKKNSPQIHPPPALSPLPPLPSPALHAPKAACNASTGDSQNCLGYFVYRM